MHRAAMDQMNQVKRTARKRRIAQKIRLKRTIILLQGGSADWGGLL
jgi:hypothetical protein